MRNPEFERCADFLSRMIEKYGSELDFSKTELQDKEKEASNAPALTEKAVSHTEINSADTLTDSQAA